MKSRQVRSFDVIVAGAGPAGCRCALTLARRGRRVLLLDRESFPRWKPCAGGITRKALPYVAPELRHLFECEVRAAWLALGPDRATRVLPDGPVGWTVHRETFDQAHLELARAQPDVEVIENCPVRGVEERADAVFVTTARVRFAAPVLVGADGVNGVVARAVPEGKDARVAIAFEAETTLPDGGLRDEVLFDFGSFPGGYGWVFPKRAQCSTGGFVFRGKLPETRGLYRAFRDRSPWLRGSSELRARGYRIPLGGDRRPVHTRRILLAGDAAGLVDPVTGEGIYFALRSGHLAGEAADDLLAGRATLEAYGRKVRREMQEDFQTAQRLAGFLYRYPKLAYHTLLRNPAVCRGLTVILAGRRDYRSLVRSLVRRGWTLPFGLLRSSPTRDIPISLSASSPTTDDTI